MAYLDIGIDLGTTTVIANDSGRKLTITEPALIAIDARSGKVFAIGEDAYRMVGRTPEYIQIAHPLRDGVISDYKMTETIIRHMIKRICNNQLVKPRLCVCIPSATTGVESQAVIEAAVSAGARSVFLIEEPVAAAIGAGIDLSQPNGNMIVDIGGGTTDVAVLSLNGLVCKTSIRVAGNRFNDAIVKHMRAVHNLLVGEKNAEQLKMDIGSVDEHAEEAGFTIKGRDLISGLPKKLDITRSEVFPSLREIADEMLQAVRNVLERTPPELVGDIHTNGIVMTGGGSLLNGLDKLIERETRVPTRVAENAVECVAIGTAKSFDYLDQLYDGFVNPSTHHH